ncbi:hypothetical protein RvY_12506-2 [Ramazzottius varieornatus]|uniref:BTB domain-containing protein n=1 Tax=Ramazzottius varieornatus TaxID=947166 RepID=A0A1D1VJQ8_RAMVA|nr:hypothetical protein RvY_12506-2 [Ramazzottius varieornatus]
MWEEEGIVVNVSLALGCRNRIFHVQGEDRVRLYPGQDVRFPYFIERNRLHSLIGKAPSKQLTLQLQVTMQERTVVYYALVRDRNRLQEAQASSEDIVYLWAEGVSIAVNRTVLQKASPIFRVTLSTEGYREAESNEVVLWAVTAQQVVDFLTDNDVTGWTLSDAVELLRVADKVGNKQRPVN